MIWTLTKTFLCEDQLALVNITGSQQKTSDPGLVLDYDGPGFLMVLGVVELLVLATTIVNITVELTCLHTIITTDPACSYLENDK